MATHILVVDDETAIADLVEVYLKNEGFTIHKFYNASDALTCVRTTRLDLAVLDVMLPDMDGFTLCQRIREEHLFPIIMLTAKVEDMDKMCIRDRNGYTHLKPLRNQGFQPFLPPFFNARFINTQGRLRLLGRT